MFFHTVLHLEIFSVNSQQILPLLRVKSLKAVFTQCGLRVFAIQISAVSEAQKLPFSEVSNYDFDDFLLFWRMKFTKNQYSEPNLQFFSFWVCLKLMSREMWVLGQFLLPHCTVWKFQDFSISQILREINFRQTQRLKNCKFNSF